ncbi:two pore domain potassium channel family protein [Candidatus Woesearchaeota archaeon]|nr:two pore domain potassium channel family protein [Candidatus Woesearchaeota archaeon]
MVNLSHLHSKENIRRILILTLFFVVAYTAHRIFSNFEQEIISAAFILLVFSGVLTYEYKSLFKKNLPKIEYFVNIFYIVFFTVLLFATIYSEGIASGENYFIENDKIADLSFSDAVYFSIITLTTVGYGDIVPVGVFRYFVMVEIFMGLIYIGTLIYILTKHLDRD